MCRKINKKKLILLISILIILLSSISIKLFFNQKSNHKITEENNKKNEVIENKVKKESVTISFAGDVTMGNYKGASYYGSFDHEFENQGQEYSYFLKNVSDIFSKDDLTVLNLEGPLTTSDNAKIKKFAFKGNPSYVNILKSGDVEAVSIANNHSEDYNEEGMRQTKFILDENNIKYFGLGEKSIINVKGIKVGLLGYNGWPENYNKEFLDSMKNDIKNMKKDADIVLPYFHWGTERKYYPDKEQIDFAHFAIDNGADAVLGSHPHVMQGIEKYKGKYIAYSLSNFCFGGNKNPKDKDTFIYQQTFNFEDNKLVSIENPNIIPCSISSTNIKNNYQPTPVKGEEADRILNKLKEISNNLNS
ncbi:CapA family protein [Paraclostridium tenue]|uniref:CapA family protein n=1 Tax=Paraclostridium tenue TaxID=1737 RepID=A0ABN1M4Z5_9FIRM